MRLRFPSLSCDERGATAIEYGLIAGLIALGIVGSLVGTRGSLNGIFGTVSSQMGSAQGASPAGQSLPSNANPRSAYWSSKTLAGDPTVTKTTNSAGTTTSTTYRFTDGSSVQVNVNPTISRDPTRIVYNDPAAKQVRYSYMSASNVQDTYEIDYASDSTLSNITSVIQGQSFDANGVPSQQVTWTQNSSGTLVSGNPVAATQALKDQAIVGQQDSQYFAGVTAARGPQ